jgi:protein-L-isoaspartate(D-aspartate) O-methyltransferase
MAAPSIEAAFAAVSRADYLPDSVRDEAAYDGPLAIGHGQTNSQPRTVAAMLELLDVRRGQRVLDVGCGSGWSTALLQHLVGPGPRVIGVEVVPELVEFGRRNLERAGVDAPSEQARAGVLGWPGEAPYDRILVSAEPRELPEELVDQLAPGGRMVIPVAGTMRTVHAAPDGPVTRTHGAYRFVPLV